MSTTASQAYSAIRGRIEASITIPLYWQGENGPPLPNPPAPFAFIMFNNEGSGGYPISFGGGVGNNTYRNQCLVEAFCFSPSNDTLLSALGVAESIAALFRSYRDEYVSCFSADVIPIGPGSSISLPGMSDTIFADYQCVVAEVEMFFDQVG